MTSSQEGLDLRILLGDRILQGVGGFMPRRVQIMNVFFLMMAAIGLALIVVGFSLPSGRKRVR